MMSSRPGGSLSGERKRKRKQPKGLSDYTRDGVLGFFSSLICDLGYVDPKAKDFHITSKQGYMRALSSPEVAKKVHIIALMVGVRLGCLICYEPVDR